MKRDKDEGINSNVKINNLKQLDYRISVFTIERYYYQ